jgi:Raf kinase inhibitor-like YbhB/YbcL family protein
MKLKSLLFFVFFVSCATNQANSAGPFRLSSTDIKGGSMIGNKHVFNSFGCSGENVSPQLSWGNAPKETKSFAITVYDPDAPTGSGWWHWALVNIPATYFEIPAGFGEDDSFKLKDGILQVRNDFGGFKFGGPCPPKGDKAHRYIFTIYALKTEKLDLEKSATAALAGFMINQNVLAKTSFTSKYKR